MIDRPPDHDLGRDGNSSDLPALAMQFKGSIFPCRRSQQTPCVPGAGRHITRSGDTMRITVQLLDAVQDRSLWPLVMAAKRMTFLPFRTRSRHNCLGGHTKADRNRSAHEYVLQAVDPRARLAY